MRRAVLALGGTVAGLILLLSFRSHTAAPAAAGVSGSDPAPASMPATAAPTPAATKATGKARAPAGGATGTRVVTGSVISSPYGPSQVAVTLTAGKITKVTVLQHTDDGQMSKEIDGNALPKLTAETLAAQSARIDAVSGASYTSAGYIKSLQLSLIHI